MILLNDVMGSTPLVACHFMFTQLVWGYDGWEVCSSGILHSITGCKLPLVRI